MSTPLPAYVSPYKRPLHMMVLANMRFWHKAHRLHILESRLADNFSMADY